MAFVKLQSQVGKLLCLKQSLFTTVKYCVTRRFINTGFWLSSAKQFTQEENKIVRHSTNVHIPEESIYSILMKVFEDQGDKIALIDGLRDQRYSYDALLNLVKSFGVSSRKHGLEKGDVMGLLSSNSPQYGVAVLGTHGCQGIVSPMNPAYTVSEIIHQLKDSNAKMLTVEENLLEKALKASEKVRIEKIFVIGDSNIEDSCIITWEDIMKENGATFPTRVHVDANNDIAFLPYSSGTTGKPKGVLLTHKNIIANILQLQYINRDLPCNSTLGVLPFFHIYGLVVSLLYTLLEGGTVVTLPNFHPETFLNSISNYKVERVNMVPPIFHFLLKHPLVDEFDLSHIKEMTTGAAPCARNLHQAIASKFPQTAIKQGYGLTETSPAAIVQPASNILPGSTGHPLPNTEVKIANIETGVPLGVDEVGEVCIRGPQVMKGYLNRSEETARCITKDGWYHTGDIGYYDNNHHFFIVDRLKELIKYKGYQVPPAELEDLLMTHSSITDAAVIGIPDEECGELPKAYVVSMGNVTEEELISYVEEKVAPHKRLRGGVEFVKAIPRAQSGKILRRVLRDLSKESTTE